jgi:hypothetical protein
VTKTVYRNNHPKIVKTTKTARCTTPGYYLQPYYEKRDADPAADAVAHAAAHADAAADADSDAHYWHRYEKCNRRGVPRWARKYSCQAIKKACRGYVKPKTRTVSRR